MAESTSIEWADHTFNPWEGCQKVGPGCDHCYAETRNARFGGGVAINWGPGAPRRRTSAGNWRKPQQWNAGAAAFQAEHGRRQRVFCASLADVFDNEVDPQWRTDLFALIESTPNLDWLLLTKRIGNVIGMVPVSWISDPSWPANVLLGATVVDQAEANRDIPKLLAVPAARRFLSVEPMLGSISFEGMFANPGCVNDGTNVLEALDWVIAGGESGPNARPSHPDWFRSLRDQCAAAGVPFLFKQWGEWIEPDLYGSNVRLTVREGDPEFETAAAAMDGFLCTDGSFAASVDDMADEVRYLGMLRVGKKAAGRLLDGVTHDGFPTVQR